MSAIPASDKALLRHVALSLCCCTLGACGPANDEPEPRGWTTAFDADDIGWLLSVWGPANDALWAVGGSEEEGRALFHDGDDWQDVELPESTPLLNWAHGFGRSDVTLVGNGGTILHFDGGEWELQPTPTEQDLWGVWGDRPDDLWAVGGRGREEGEATLLHFDGEEWSAQVLPEFERSGVSALFKVWGSADDDIYAVGQRGAVLHYDGDEWTEQLVGASDDLIALWGTGPDLVVAVGGRGLGIVSIWDGEQWRTESLAPIAGLNGIWMQDAERAFVGGVNGTAATLDLTDLESLEVTEEVVDTTLDLHGVFGVGDRLYAVGGNFLGPTPPYEGVALVRDIDTR